MLGIPLIRGRIFDERDGANAPHVAVISESLARDRWPNQDPIGQTIEFGNMDGDLRVLTIVGIVGDTHEYGLDAPPRPTVYVNLFQRPRAAMTLTMLSDADTRSVTAAARGILQDLEPGDSAEIPDVSAGLFRVAGLAQIQRDSDRFLRDHRAAAGDGGSVRRDGLLGQPPHARNRRARGAGRELRRRSGMILGQGLRTICIGVAIGIAGALALTRTLASLLFGVTATDPLTFGGVTLLLVGAALLACYIPARRATKVDPMVALRYE